MEQKRCALCKQRLDPDSPFSVYGRNPLTNREAWMHDLCAISAYDELSNQPSSDPKYKDKQDEYNTRFA